MSSTIKLTRLSRPRTRSVDTDNDEREPLLSSENSRTSLGPPFCMFYDSENSDLEVNPIWQTSKKRQLNCLYVTKRPYSEDNLQIYKKNLQFYHKSDFFKVPATENEAPKTNSVVTIFSIWNTMVGTSLLAMPWGMEHAGLVGGLLLCVLMGGMCLYTAYCNVVVYKDHGKPGSGELFELCRDLLGPVVEYFAKVFSVIVLLGANIVYWVLLANFLYNNVHFIYEYAHDTDNTTLTWNSEVTCKSLNEHEGEHGKLDHSYETFNKFWDLQKTVPLYLIVVLAPVLNFKSPTFFAKFTSLGTLSVIYIMLFALIKCIVWGPHIEFSDPSSDFFGGWVKTTFQAMSGMLSLSYFIHNIIISLIRHNRQQQHNVRDLSISYTLVILTYLFIGVLVFVSFPRNKACIEDNILNNFKVQDILTLVARFFLFFQLVTVFPLIAFMLRTQVMVIIFGKTYPSIVHVAVFNVLLITVCVLFAVFIPHIGGIIRYTGALAGLVHVFTIPCLLRMASQKKEGTLTCLSKIIHICIPLLGLTNLILQFFM